jgi:hypothetical protein
MKVSVKSGNNEPKATKTASARKEMNINTEAGGAMTTVQGSSSMTQVNQGGAASFIQASEIYKAAEIPQGNNSVAVYSGHMDVGVINPSDITADGLLANPEYSKLNASQAAARLAKLTTLEANLDVAIQERVVVRKGIQVSIEDQKIARAAYNYSTEVSLTEQAADTAKTAHFMTGVRKKNNELTRIEGVAKLVNKAARVANVVSKAQATALPEGMSVEAIFTQASNNEAPQS